MRDPHPATPPTQIESPGTSPHSARQPALRKDASEAPAAIPAKKAPRQTRPLSPILTVAIGAARLCFAFVFVVNVQCALGFVLTPEAYLGAYELAGVPGRVAAQGIGIAFLMWNCTYPAFIAAPRRFTALGVVILVQQAVGLIGESFIRITLPAGHELLASSIDLFITFDAVGLVLMGASFAFLQIAKGRSEERPAKRED